MKRKAFLVESFRLPQSFPIESTLPLAGQKDRKDSHVLRARFKNH